MNDESDTKSQSDPVSLPKGVVLGPDGKPCRSCTSKSAFSAWVSTTRKQQPLMTSTSTSSENTSLASKGSRAYATQTAPSQDGTDCPPDVDILGKHSWTLLHSIAATYPTRPSASHQRTTLSFISSFSQLYPCWTCASDFREWMADADNAPRVSNREEFGQWMCEAHNAVNEKLGKEIFDCGRWEERWRSGWKDGRCD